MSNVNTINLSPLRVLMSVCMLFTRRLRMFFTMSSRSGRPDDVLPYFNRLEHDLDFAGPLHGAAGALEKVKAIFPL